MKATKCDICKKYIDTSIGQIGITVRGSTFPDPYDVCDSCMTEIKRLIKTIYERPEVEK